jgi:hypothetical protein
VRTKKGFERGGGDRLVLHTNAVGNRGVIAVLAGSGWMDGGIDVITLTMNVNQNPLPKRLERERERETF